MKLLGTLFIIAGVLLTFLGFYSYASDIQLIVAFIGICMAGLGVIMIAIGEIREDLYSTYQWVKKGQEE
jgi:Ca2+/Na+ antiporter